MDVRRRLRHVVATAFLTAFAASTLTVAAPQPDAAGAPVAGPLRTIGALPEPVPAKDGNRSGTVVHVDAESRRLFFVYPDRDAVLHLATYDLRPRIPKQIAGGRLGPEISFGVVSPYSVAFDSKRDQLLFVDNSVEGSPDPRAAGLATFVVYSVRTNAVVTRWRVNDRVAGFYPMGVTYSRADDRYYAVGDFTADLYVADSTVTGGGRPVAPGPGVAAFDPDSGALGWLRVVPECQTVLFSKSIGANVARSSRTRPALYFMCVSSGSPMGQTYPGQSGLVRQAIAPRGTSADQLHQPTEFFPISGSYYSGGQATGVTTFDSRTERFYAQSISNRTPGAWVFDGELTAWVGFVSSPSNANYYIGLNEGLGHLYMGTARGGDVEPTDGLLVADVRQTPVPAGEFQQILTSGLIVADAKSNRLFVRPLDSRQPYLVLEDTLPVYRGREQLDYDADTSDTPDTEDAEVFYALGATGYAAQAVQVGGAGAPGTMTGAQPDIPVNGGTRALMAARVGAIDLRAGGAAASAQSAMADLNTLQEYEAEDRDADGKKDQWPYPVGACLDAGGRPVNQTWKDESGRTDASWTIQCDVTKNVATSVVRMSSTGPGGHIADTSYAVTATRDRKDGGVVRTDAIASGVRLDIAGGYTLRLGRVAATSQSSAHGRPGTARAVWTREVDGVRVTDPNGMTIYTAAGCASKVEATGGKPVVNDTCGDLGTAINTLVPTRLRVSFPVPDVTATPKGAFAAVEQTESQYFQQLVVNDQGVVYRGDSVGLRPAPALVTEVYNDTTERSRTVTVFAATQSNAVFQVNPPFEDGYVAPVDPGPSFTEPPVTGGPSTVDAPPIQGKDTGSGDIPTTPIPPQTAPGPATTPTVFEQVRGFLFMRRSVQDITLLILLAGLLIGGAGTTARRRRLVDVLVTVPRKEAL
ncbi:MAG TPA: hypothetical protein VNA20_04645 [Frankiaceae bacterium]|nr:hypothetical protein [Frankiaceae bacterium]